MVSVYGTVVGYILKISHHHHICNCWFTNSICCIQCRYVEDWSLYKMFALSLWCYLSVCQI